MQEAEDSIQIGGVVVPPGETRHIKLKISESFISTPVQLPVTIVNGVRNGPHLVLTAASHGDEMNGTAMIRELIFNVDHTSLAGALFCVPVMNIPGFLAQSRDLPDGRDLNRYFPGKPDGNPAQRMAGSVFAEIIRLCDYGLDLHTAGEGRINLLQVRGDMDNAEVRRIALAFGTEVIIDEVGISGTLRRAATEQGVPTITVEAGEPLKFEKEIVRQGLQGVLNVLYELGMLLGEKKRPPFQIIVKETEWVRADRGGILEMKARAGQLVREEAELCSITNPFGKEVDILRAPFTGIVVGVTTRPVASPGSPICHLVKVAKNIEAVEAAIKRTEAGLPPQPGAELVIYEEPDPEKKKKKEEKAEKGERKEESKVEKRDKWEHPA